MIKKLGSSCYFVVVLFNFSPFLIGNFSVLHRHGAVCVVTKFPKNRAGPVARKRTRPSPRTV
jgi:hypothetical protein